MNSGGTRANITAKQHRLTIGENRTLRFTVRGEDGEPLTVWPGGFLAHFFWLRTLEIDGQDELLAEATWHDEAVLGTAPVIEVDLTDERWDGITAEPQAYELWRWDEGNRRRLAFGTIELIN